MKKNVELPEWEDVLSSAARLQQFLPEAVLVGGTASSIYADHRLSCDADHVLTNLKEHFDEVLAQLESVAGWQTARTKRPVLILGSLDGIETGVRQLIRKEPLEKTQKKCQGQLITVPTDQEILRIKGILILTRNATRDYLDFVALADYVGDEKVCTALQSFDRLYQQANGESPLQQLIAQLANAIPYDLEETDLSEYKNLNPKWHDWNVVKKYCSNLTSIIFDSVASIEKDPDDSPGMGM